jgi:GUN4-like
MSASAKLRLSSTSAFRKSFLAVIYSSALLSFGSGCTPNSGSQVKIDSAEFSKLDQLLISRQWRDANDETKRLIIHFLPHTGNQINPPDLLDEEAIAIYPCQVLREIDRFWLRHSQNRFGYSIQNKIWSDLGGTFDMKKFDDSQQSDLWFKFRKQIGWQTGFQTDAAISSTAPIGYLPSDISSNSRYDTELGGITLLARTKECDLITP